VVDHILVSNRLGSRALCVDLEIPNNDKEKDIIVTKKIIYLPPFFTQFSVIVYRKKYSNCVHVVVVSLGDLKRIIHESFFMPCLSIFHQQSRIAVRSPLFRL